MRLAVPMFTILGVSDLPSLFLDGSIPWLFFTFLLLSIITIGMGYRRLTPTELLSPKKCQFFYPFLANLDTPLARKFSLTRAGQLDEFSSQLSELDNRILVLYGDSGVGKTTLVNDYVSIDADDKNKLVISYERNYVDTIYRIIAGEDNVLLDRSYEGLIGELFSEHTELKRRIDICTKIVEKMDAILGTQTAELFIDQAERLPIQLDTSEKHYREGVLLFLTSLANSRKFKVILIVRSDYLAKLISYIPASEYELYRIEGIDISNEKRSSDVFRERMLELNIPTNDIDSLRTIILDGRNINTFIFQLTGYLIECFGSKPMLGDSARFVNSDKDIIELFVDKMLDEYGFLARDHIRAADLELTLFAVACFNKKTGRALNYELLPKLAHISERNAHACVDYLRAKNVIVQNDEPQSLRIVHDLLIEQILSRESRYIISDDLVSIERLVDKRVDISTLTQPLEATHPYLNPVRRNESGRVEPIGVETILLWCAALAYWYRFAFPEETFALLEPIISIFNLFRPGILYPPEIATAHFYPIAFTQYLWVIFIYGLNRGFFFYLYKKGDINIAYHFLSIIGPVGALLGLIFSYTPALFILAIAIPGLCLSFVYFYIYVKSNSRANIYQYIWKLSYATALNMLISIAVSYLLTFALISENDSQVVGQLFNTYFVCALFCYFAYEMRTRQGSEHGRNGMLSQYDLAWSISNKR